MAAANLTNHTPLSAVRTISGNTPLTSAVPEYAGQTFPIGAVVEIYTGGFTKVWDGTTYTAGIYGIAQSFGLNLAYSGLGAPAGFGGVTGSGAIQTWGNVPNQPSAVNIALGTPISDGRTLVVQASPDVVFQGQFDNSAGATAADYTPTQAMLNLPAGQCSLTVDANGNWYVDIGKTTHPTIQIIGVNPLNVVSNNNTGTITYAENALVFFQFIPSAVQN
jgi:hypothetical protein